MHGLDARRFDLELREVVSEASRALALLDAERLEELARACEALNRDALNRDALKWDHVERAAAARQARDAAGEMAVFARVLDATRANLAVMNRLRDLREGAMFYQAPDSQMGRLMLTESSDGND